MIDGGSTLDGRSADKWLLAFRRKERTKLAKDLKAQSTFSVINPWHYAKLGATKAWGFYGLVWPEVMHQTESGTMKRASESIVKLMENYGKATGTVP
jgi:hypothetical protein